MKIDDIEPWVKLQQSWIELDMERIARLRQLEAASLKVAQDIRDQLAASVMSALKYKS